MNPALLLPLGLAALAGLIVPLLVHLARRSEQHPIDFAALRWLRPKPRPRHRLRFDEWPLLWLRLLLVALIALWLARPVLIDSADARAFIAVVPGVDVAALQATAKPRDVRLRWLAPGFPDALQPAPGGPLPIGSLVRQLDAQLPAQAKLTVVVPSILQGADAQRPRLSRAVDWQVVPGAMPIAAAAPEIQPVLVVRHSADRADAVRYMRAAALAWQATATPASSGESRTTVDVTSLATPLPSGAYTLAWLAPGPLPPAVVAWIEAGGTALLDADATLPPPAAMSRTEWSGVGNKSVAGTDAAPRAATVLWRDASGAPLLEGRALGKGRVLRFTRALAPAEMPELLEADFPQQLRAVLQPAAAAPARVMASDYAPTTGGATYAQPPRELQPWLALLIAAFLLVERWMATRRKRGIAP